MTSMERVLAALKGEDADRRAFTMTLSLYGAKLTGCPLPDYYTIPERYLEGQIAVAEQCEPDIIFMPFALALEAQAFGSEIKYLEKSPPNVRKLAFRTTADLERLAPPDINKDSGIRYLTKSAELLVGHFGKRVPVCGVLTAPMDLPAILMGVENWLEILLFKTSEAAAIIDCMADYFVRCANEMFNRGVAFIAMAMVFCNPKIIPEKCIAEFIIPALSKIFAQVKGPLVFHHGSVPIASSLPLFLGLPNVAGFVVDNRDSLDEVRRIAGVSTLLLGNIDGPALCRMGSSLACEKTAKILENRKSDRHFIFATSNADVAWDTPVDTIRGIRDLMRN